MNKNVTALILIVLAGGIYFSFTRGKIAEVQAVRAVNDEYSSALLSAQRLIEVRQDVLKKYNDILPKDRERLDKIIPNTVDNIRLIIDLNSLAKQHGFPLKNIKATASPSSSKASAPTPASAQSQSNILGAGTSKKSAGIPTPTLDTVSVSFSVSAPYQQFIDFMKDLESSLRILDLTHLTISVNAGGTYDFSVELKTYWLRQ